MGNFYLFAALILFAISVYVLSRGNDWSRSVAFVVAFATVAFPVAMVFVQTALPLPRIVAQTLGGLALVVPFLVLFALSKSVTNRLKDRAHAPR